MFVDWIMTLWSVAGLVWWLVAWRLVGAERSPTSIASLSGPRRSLSIFKPLPPLGEAGLAGIEAGLESFVAQLDDDSELLLGVHEADRELITPFLNRLRGNHPQARLKIIFRSTPDEAANPKIAWQRYLAPQAEGELWLWSDADIIAPPDFLRTACADFVQSGVRMMTFPYVVRQITTPPALLEALFVNVEFYPGVLLLRRSGTVDFGLGAAMLFRRDDFLREVDWDDLGSRLADDFFLGRALQPVRIGTTTLLTVPTIKTWKEGILHDLRWSKTIRWNRPWGFFSRLMILPVLGWLIVVALSPTHFIRWVGLLGMIQAEVLAATALCRGAGCRLKIGDVMRLELWSLWRIALWISSWLPGSIAWSGRKWCQPQAGLGEIKLTTT